MDKIKCINCHYINIKSSSTVAYRCLNCLLINCVVCGTIHDNACDLFKNKAISSSAQKENPPEEKSMDVGSEIPTKKYAVVELKKFKFCSICSKQYKSFQTYKRHLKSQKHFDKVKKDEDKSVKMERYSSAETVVNDED